MIILNSKVKKDGAVVKENGEKTENLHRDNIDSKEKETSREGIQDYSSASTTDEQIQALHKRLKSMEKIVHGNQIHAGGDA